MPAFPVLRSLRRTLVFHLGSIALGSFVIAVVQFVRLVLEYLDKKTRKVQEQAKVRRQTFRGRCWGVSAGGGLVRLVAPSCLGSHPSEARLDVSRLVRVARPPPHPQVAAWLMCGVKFLVWLLEKIVAFINRNAYIIVAVKGCALREGGAGRGGGRAGRGSRFGQKTGAARAAARVGRAGAVAGACNVRPLTRPPPVGRIMMQPAVLACCPHNCSRPRSRLQHELLHQRRARRAAHRRQRGPPSDGAPGPATGHAPRARDRPTLPLTLGRGLHCVDNMQTRNPGEWKWARTN